MLNRILPLSALFLTACPEDPGYQPDPDRVARTVTSAEGDIGAVVEGNNTFTFDTYGELLATAGDGNVFFSPFSITSALSMTMAGAEGTTETEMMDVLGADIPEANWHGGMGDLTLDLSGDLHRAYTLHVANRLFGQSDYPWEEVFLGVCEDDYGAPLEPWDFVSDPDGGRERVNDWVAEQTQDRITDLLPAGSVTSDTRLVLANAIYFLADWKNQFDPADTQDGAFSLLDGGSVTVPLMRLDLEGVEDHGVEAGWTEAATVARLPYEDDEISMVLVIPNETDGLPALEASLDADTYAGFLAALGHHDGTVVMPKVEMTYEAELKGAMMNLGMPSAFDSVTADFTGMADVIEDGRLHIDGIFHKAFVSIDEKGTEAAAATGVVVGVDSAPMEVRADHPYLFFIQDDLTGTILFMGRVTDPS